MTHPMKLPFKPTKCWVKLVDENPIDADFLLVSRYGLYSTPGILMPSPPIGHEWVLKPTAGKGRGKK